MIPRTFPSSRASNGSTQMIVYFLPSVSGLTRWVDYIPVKFTTVATAATENTYNQNGYIPVVSISSIAGATPFKEYVPVFLDSSAADADVWDVTITGFIPVGTAGIGGAALYMDFAATTTLDSRVTFSRTTNATLTNSAGLVANAPMNLLTFSEQFDNAAWGKTAGTVTANTSTAPDGTITADQIASTGAGVFRASISVSQGVLHTASVYAKYVSGAGNFLFGFDAGPASGRASFNLQTGVVVSSEANVVSSSITAVGDGWYRCVVSAITTSTTCILVYYNATSGANWLVWGAQLNVGALQPYNPTTVKNLLGFTEHFDNAAWTKSNASISATKVDDIYGQPFAQQVTSSASNGTVLSTYTAVASTPYTFSIWMKRVTGTGNIDISADGTTWATRTLTTEWQRFSVTASSTAGSKTPGVRIATSGDSIYIFGAQLSDSASVDPYVYQPVAAPSSVTYYGPRFDYDPVTLAPKGLLIEEQRTQLLLNSSIAGTSLATQNVTVSAVAHTLSFYGTGTVTLSGVSTAGPLVGAGAYPNRATLTFTPTAGTLTLTVTGTVQFAQLEVGAFATSFIPSAASQVTRAADSASMIGNNFARWYNQTEGTLFSDVVFNSASVPADQLVFQVDNGSNDQRNKISRYAAVFYGTTRITGSTVADMSLGTATGNTSYKVDYAYKVNDFAGTSNAGTVATDTSGAVPVPLTTANIGRNGVGGEFLNGTIKRIAYYNRRLSNSELQAITS